MVLQQLCTNFLSLYCSKMALLPTPELPIISTLTIRSLIQPQVTIDDCSPQFCSLLDYIIMSQANFSCLEQEIQPDSEAHSDLISKNHPETLLNKTFLGVVGSRQAQAEAEDNKCDNPLDADSVKIKNENEQEHLCCLQALCVQESRIFAVQSETKHQGHKVVSLSSLLKKMEVLKCNQPLKRFEPKKVQSIFEGMDEVFRQIVQFQAEILQTFAKIKTQTLRHINQVKASFTNQHFQQLRQKLRREFNYLNVQFVLMEVEKYQKLSYATLDYPQFKVHMLRKRCTQLKSNYKLDFLSQLSSCVGKFCGENSQKNSAVKYNRSLATFMFKSVSEQPIFSYYLRNHDYLVTHHGKRLKRIQMDASLPIAVIERRVNNNPIKIKIVKDSVQGLAIGCGVLSKMEKSCFQNAYSSGYFLHSSGVVFSNNSRFKNAFTFGQNDIVGIRIEEKKLLFNKIKEGSVVSGFYIDLRAQQAKKDFSFDAFYVAVMLGSLVAEVEIFQ